MIFSRLRPEVSSSCHLSHTGTSHSITWTQLGFLLARRLPEPPRLQGPSALLVAVIVALTVVFGVYSGVSGIWG